MKLFLESRDLLDKIVTKTKTKKLYIPILDEKQQNDVLNLA